MRRAPLLAMLTLSVSLFLAGGAFGAGASSSPAFSTPVTLNLGNIQPSHRFVLDDVSCIGVGSCTAVGSAGGVTPSDLTPVEVTETDGVWEKAVQSTSALFPLVAVQCFTVGNCVAVGTSINGTSNSETPIAMSEVNGVWQQAVSINLPANLNVGESWMDSLSCRSMDACTALGTHLESIDDSPLFVVNETDGTWQTATQMGVASGYQLGSASWFISCSSTNTCTAAGQIQNSSTRFAGTATETDGTWNDASPISTRHTNVTMGTISCRTATTCVAVGEQSVGLSLIPLIYDDINGTWREIEVSDPLSGKTPYLKLFSISCTSIGDCDVVGDATLKGNPFIIVESHGKWLKPVLLPLASSMNAKTAGAVSISCVSSAACTVVGWQDLSGNRIAAIAWTLR